MKIQFFFLSYSIKNNLLLYYSEAILVGILFIKIDYADISIVFIVDTSNVGQQAI